MSIKVYRNISCLVSNAKLPSTNGLFPKESHLGIIKDGALVYSKKEGVLWLGKDKNLPKAFSTKPYYNCKNFVAYPGFVDSHTHLIFAGNRAKEYAMRMEGKSYAEIAQSGGGILSTVKNTRKASKETLYALGEKRLKEAYNFGVRLLEAKSGYGLSEKSEIKILEVLKDLREKKKNIEVVSTCLAAHAIPSEYKRNRKAWIKKICTSILPKVKKNNLASFVDVFCDEGYFTIEETREIFSCAKKLNFHLKLHGDELKNTGASELAAEMKALSVDHVLKISKKGIRALSASSTVATLLPGTSLFLKENPAPARKLIDAGVAVALATDFNPGSCTTQNLPFIATLASLHLNMNIAEIIAAITWNGARALAREKNYGTLLPGYLGEPSFCEGDHPAALYYRMAPSSLGRPILTQ